MVYFNPKSTRFARQNTDRNSWRNNRGPVPETPASKIAKLENLLTTYYRGTDIGAGITDKTQLTLSAEIEDYIDVDISATNAQFDDGDGINNDDNVSNSELLKLKATVAAIKTAIGSYDPTAGRTLNEHIERELGRDTTNLLQLNATKVGTLLNDVYTKVQAQVNAHEAGLAAKKKEIETIKTNLAKFSVDLEYYVNQRAKGLTINSVIQNVFTVQTPQPPNPLPRTSNPIGSEINSGGEAALLQDLITRFQRAISTLKDDDYIDLNGQSAISAILGKSDDIIDYATGQIDLANGDANGTNEAKLLRYLTGLDPLNDGLKTITDLAKADRATQAAAKASRLAQLNTIRTNFSQLGTALTYLSEKNIGIPLPPDVVGANDIYSLLQDDPITGKPLSDQGKIVTPLERLRLQAIVQAYSEAADKVYQDISQLALSANMPTNDQIIDRIKDKLSESGTPPGTITLPGGNGTFTINTTNFGPLYQYITGTYHSTIPAAAPEPERPAGTSIGNGDHNGLKTISDLAKTDKATQVAALAVKKSRINVITKNLTLFSKALSYLETNDIPFATVADITEMLDEDSGKENTDPTYHKIDSPEEVAKVKAILKAFQDAAAVVLADDTINPSYQSTTLGTPRVIGIGAAIIDKITNIEVDGVPITLTVEQKAKLLNYMTGASTINDGITITGTNNGLKTLTDLTKVTGPFKVGNTTIKSKTDLVNKIDNFLEYLKTPGVSVPAVGVLNYYNSGSSPF